MESLRFSSPRFVIAVVLAGAYGLVSLAIGLFVLILARATVATPTQAVFFVLMGVVTPQVAIVLIGMPSRSFLERLRTTARFLGWTYAAWALASGLAVALFPRYPRSAPHETVAMLFALPGALAGGAALWFALRDSGLKNRARWIWLGVVWILPTALVIQVARTELRVSIRDALPITVRNLQTSDYEDIAGVSQHAVRASMSQEASSRYARALECESTADEMPEGPLFPHAAWWTPRRGGPVWARGADGCSTYVTYVDGDVYALSSCFW